MADVNTNNEYFSKSNVLFIYKLYLKELIKYTLIYVQTRKVTENDSSINTFCFTRSNTAGELKVPNAQKNSVLYNFLLDQNEIPPLNINLSEFALKNLTDRIMNTIIINGNVFERLFM